MSKKFRSKKNLGTKVFGVKKILSPTNFVYKKFWVKRSGSKNKK